jgi:hypothetical protein
VTLRPCNLRREERGEWREEGGERREERGERREERGERREERDTRDLPQTAKRTTCHTLYHS